MKFNNGTIESNISNDLEVLHGATKYCEWIFNTFDSYLGNRVLEIGAGTGNITQFLLNKDFVFATDISEVFVEKLKLKFGDRHNFHASVLDAVDLDNWTDELRGFEFSNIILNNVLEHIENDSKVLEGLVNCLPKGGLLSVIVPANPCLFNSLDTAYGHYRRYTHADFTEFSRKLNMKLINIQYFNMLGILGWFLNGTLFKRTSLPTGQTGAFNLLVPMLRKFEALLSLPFGLSLSVTLQK